jgi:hypothetical protein
MSSAGIQNYLSNVFRQVYTYDTVAAVFTPKLELSNINTYSGNSVSVFTAAIGDSAGNVYVGSNAGNPYNIIQACSNVTAVGFGAGSNISNVSNSVYIGANAGAGSSGTGVTPVDAVIAIGVSSIGGGLSNISIGNGTGSVGTSNILIGHSFGSVTGSNQIRIGMSNNIALAGNSASNWIGIGGVLNPVDATNKLDVSGNARIQGNLSLNRTPGERTLDVNGNFRATDGVSNVLDFSNGVTTSSNGFASAQTATLVPVGSSTIAPLKKGIILVSAVDTLSSTNRAAYVLFAYSDSNATNLSSNISGATDIVVSGVNIQISNTGIQRLYTHSVTYFRMP